MENLDTKLLRSFISVATTGSMTQTAHHLNQTQGAVSQQIKRLEGVVGRALFLRSGPRLALTVAGQDFLPYAQDIVATCDAALARFQPDVTSHHIRFGMPYDLVAAYLSPMLDRFSASFPNIDVELHCEASPTLKTMVDDGDLDLVMIEEPVTDASGDILHVEPLVWIGKPGGRAHKERPLPVSLVAETCAFRSSVHTSLDQAGLIWRTVFENGDINATMSTIRSDMSVSAGLKCLVPPDLTVLTPNEGLPELPRIAITVYPRDVSLSTSARELARSIQQALTSQSESQRA